jgi:hypothetical protein
VTLEPDSKDWTWVLDAPCPECGVDTRLIAPTEVGELVRGTVPRWRAVLDGEAPGRRTRPDAWSPLEYACHVRDAYRRFDERLTLMLRSDDPLFPNWDQDATARYFVHDPLHHLYDVTGRASG